jgi:hypothetical protein
MAMSNEQTRKLNCWHPALEGMSCWRCDENDPACLAITRQGWHEHVCCHNCRWNARHNHILGRCSVCERTNVPIEQHHVARACYQPEITVPVCLNCHALLSTWQRDWREEEWLTQSPTIVPAAAAAAQGAIDLLMLVLLRSPAWYEREELRRAIVAALSATNVLDNAFPIVASHIEGALV